MKIDRYILTEEKEKRLWNDGIVVFDTSSLLNFYDYSDNTIQAIFNSTFKDLSDRLWIPYNVRFEYDKNRLKPINGNIKQYDDLTKHLKVILEHFKQINNKTQSQEKHPIIDNQITNVFESHLNVFKEQLEGDIKKRKENLENSKSDDKVLSKFSEIFSFGEPYSFSRIMEIITVGELRFRHKIPPGYKDENDKIGFQKFADLIIWNQIIDFAKEKKLPILYVMDDNKEDWWILDKEKKAIKPREELLEEMLDKAGVEFWMYNTTDFIKVSNRILGSDVGDGTIEEIKQVANKKIERVVEGIYLSANREEDEPWRIERLGSVARFYAKTIPKIHIRELHDHKGMLTAV